ncbi:putative transglutaminase-like cysteine proteinase [Aminobacter niigataensis]|uniref:Transglutaminase-like cysteine proteinase n=1 Tax=Aminobacter niigataensis TaxID=83265 RepID=A0ABR6L3X5_9HYPH|nr:transglutaminase-like cysteine peptidase [Aminobacter niigataensis]MBB4651445.1 putative transglutaminase-like cysteine proteinase [Aminobacter niigataensis]
MISAAGVRCAAGRAGVFLGLVAGVVLSAGAALAASQPMVTGGLTSQPIGHYDFCRLNPRECSIKQRDTGPERMTGALWRKMVAVNVATNAAIKPMNDIDIYGRDEVWIYPANGEGDCEDYVLEKRRMLSQEGVSLANLLITVVRKPDGEGHAVLTVRTSKGDFVLDNLTDTVRQWDETGYRYLKRQSSENTGRWVSIREGQATMVGSVK